MLNLSANPLGGEGSLPVASFLQSCKGLATLRLAHCQLAVAPVAASLVRNTRCVRGVAIASRLRVSQGRGVTIVSRLPVSQGRGVMIVSRLRVSR